MARVFAFLMQKNIEITDESIFSDASAIIYNFLNELYSKDNNYTCLSERSLVEALVKVSKN